MAFILIFSAQGLLRFPTRRKIAGDLQLVAIEWTLRDIQLGMWRITLAAVVSYPRGEMLRRPAQAKIIRAMRARRPSGLRFDANWWERPAPCRSPRSG
jgi:hypothetical protein